MTRTKTLCVAAAFGAASLLFSQPARRALKIDDMHRFHDVRDAQISPDGKWVAYTVNTVDSVADKSDTDVWIASWDGKQHLRMTTSTESESSPRWSPDGRWLAFLSSRPGKVKGNQVWLLDRNGGEAQQFTDVKGRLTSYDWSPDAKKLLLVMADRDPNDPADVESKKAEVLTDAVLEAASPSWSPDGKWIAFMGRSGKDAERYNTTNVFVMEPRAGATPREITKYDGLHGSASRGRPEWSPDGTKLAYLQSSGAKLGAYNMNRLAVVAVSGGEPKILAGGLDRGVSAPRFTPDGAGILFLVGDDASEYPARIPANGGDV